MRRHLRVVGVESCAPETAADEDAKKRFHAMLARDLYAACGGLEEILARRACRVGRTALRDYGNPLHPAFMPADVLGDLEAYAGVPVYSRALVDGRPSASDAVAGVAEEVCEVGEAAIDLQRIGRLAAADGDLSPREKAEIEKAIAFLKDQVRDLEAAVSRGQA